MVSTSSAMSLVVASVFVLVAVVSSKPHYSRNLDDEWAGYKYGHGKTYDSYANEVKHRVIWEANREKVRQHNIRYSRGESSYFMGMNKFSDLSFYMFLKTMTGFVVPSNDSLPNVRMYRPPLNSVEEDSVDWRTEGLVTEVKNQQQCGSCWSFSTTGALEGQWARAGNPLVSLSEQNLLDCAIDAENKGEGCHGGNMNQAYDFIKQEGGIESEQDYPYTAVQQTCSYDPSKKAASLTGYVQIEQGSEDDLTDALTNEGPISVAITVTDNFPHYQGGVFDDDTCAGQPINHAVLTVGYGDDDGDEYYIVKNSWGQNWGESGYIRMSRNKDNQCSIASWATYPTV